MSVTVYSKDIVDCMRHHSVIFFYFVMHRIKPNDCIELLKRPGLPFLHLGYNLIGNSGKSLDGNCTSGVLMSFEVLPFFRLPEKRSFWSRWVSISASRAESRKLLSKGANAPSLPYNDLPERSCSRAFCFIMEFSGFFISYFIYILHQTSSIFHQDIFYIVLVLSSLFFSL